MPVTSNSPYGTSRQSNIARVSYTYTVLIYIILYWHCIVEVFAKVIKCYVGPYVISPITGDLAAFFVTQLSSICDRSAC